MRTSSTNHCSEDCCSPVVAHRRSTRRPSRLCASTRAYLGAEWPERSVQQRTVENLAARLSCLAVHVVQKIFMCCQVAGRQRMQAYTALHPIHWTAPQPQRHCTATYLGAAAPGLQARAWPRGHPPPPSPGCRCPAQPPLPRRPQSPRCGPLCAAALAAAPPAVDWRALLQLPPTPVARPAAAAAVPL